jgi:hypothetical protein
MDRRTDVLPTRFSIGLLLCLVTLTSFAEPVLHFGYTSYQGLYYLNNAGGSWTTTLVPSFDVKNYGGGLALDSANKAHISFFRGLENAYASNQTGAWVAERVTPNTLNTPATALALSSTKEVRYAYAGEQAYSLSFRAGRSGAWRPRVDLVRGIWTLPYVSPATAVDEHDRSYVLASRPAGGGNPYPSAIYVSPTGLQVAASCRGGLATGAVVTDVNNGAHLIYACNTGSAINVLYGYIPPTGGSVRQRVLSAYGTMTRPSMMVDNYNKLHVVFYDSRGNLIYGKSMPNQPQWTFSTIARVNPSAMTLHPQIATDTERKAHVIYLQRIPGALSDTIYYTHNRSGVFTAPVVVARPSAPSTMLWGIGVNGEEGFSNFTPTSSIHTISPLR